MKQCWRWFGPDDPIVLADLHQIGVQGIVTALHHIPPGEPWDEPSIADRQALLAAAGYSWDVVESLPVSEAIKTQSADMAEHLQAYKSSLRALSARGIKVVCYNFMPILDWTRTAPSRPAAAREGTAMLFDLTDFAVFDIHILKRPGASEDYSSTVQQVATDRFLGMSDHSRAQLKHNVTAGLPGANDQWSVQDVRALLQTYAHIDRDRLRANLIDFLSEVAPVAQKQGLRLCCHPDDPPFSLLGLPRIMSSTDDYGAVLDAVDLSANGATLCTGSLGVSPEFDGPDFVRRHGDRNSLCPFAKHPTHRGVRQPEAGLL